MGGLWTQRDADEFYYRERERQLLESRRDNTVARSTQQVSLTAGNRRCLRYPCPLCDLGCRPVFYGRDDRPFDKDREPPPRPEPVGRVQCTS